jgi:hypothetical protein
LALLLAILDLPAQARADDICAAEDHPAVQSLAAALSRSATDPRALAQPGEFRVRVLDRESWGSPRTLEVAFVVSGKTAAQANLPHTAPDGTGASGGTYDALARGGTLRLIWTTSGSAGCRMRCFWDVTVSPQKRGFAIQPRPDDPTAPCGEDAFGYAAATAVPSPRSVETPRPVEGTAARSITITVPGWIGLGLDTVPTHVGSTASVLALPLGEDYLSRPFGAAIGDKEEIVPFRWSGALGDTFTHTHLLGPDPPGAAPELIGRILGNMAEAYLRAQRSHGLVSLNIEAHSWGGVLAYLALKGMEKHERFAQYVHGGVLVNLDTMGSPVGCLDRDTLDRQTGQSAQRALVAGMSAGVAPDAAMFLGAFKRAGLSLQSVALGPNVTWRNYRIQEDDLACDVAGLPLDRKHVLPFDRSAGKAHSQYYAVLANARMIVANRTPRVYPLPVSR